MANGGYDGSIIFSTGLDNKKLEKQLAGLTKKIEKKTQDIAKLTQKRDAAKGNSLFDGGLLDAENRKLHEMRDLLADFRARARDKNLSLMQRDEAKAMIPSLKEEYADQKTRVNGLRAEWNKLHNAVERYDAQIAEATAELERQKRAAGQIQEKLDGSSGAGAQERMAAYLERNSTLYQQAAGLLGKTADASAVLQGLAGATSGKLSGAFQTASAAVGSFGTALSGVVAKAAPFLAVVTAIFGLLKKLWSAAVEFAAGFTNALKRGAASVYSFSSAVARNFVAALKAIGRLSASFVKTVTGITKNIVQFTKRLNAFSQMAKTLGSMLKQLGSTIKSALVFSVIYQGLALIRQQMGAYLMVNTQFSTALRQLQGVLLTAFQPIYDAVVPALTTLMNVLSRVIAAISQFTAALFGTTAKQAQKNAEALHKEANALKEAGSAAEKAAGSLAGFDEINQIQTENKGGGGSGASQEAGPSFDYEYVETAFDSWGEAFSAILDNLLDGIPKLKSAFSYFADWLNDFSKKLYDMFTFPGVLEKVQQLGRDLANAFNNLVNNINWYQLGQALGAGLNLALQFLVNFLYTFDWMNLGTKLAEFINGAVSEIDWYTVGMLLWAGFKIAIETLAGLLLGLDMVALADAASNLVIGFFDSMTETIQKIPWAQIGDQIAKFLNNIDWYGVLTSAIKAIQAALRAFQQTVAGFVRTLKWSEIAEEIYTAINESLGNINWRQMGQTLGDLFIHVLDFVRDVVSGINWYEIGQNIADLITGFDFASALGSLADALAAGINAAIALARGFLDNLMPEAQGIAEGIAERLKNAVVAVEWDALGGIIGDSIKSALSFVAGLLDPELFGEIGQAIGDFLVNLDWPGIVGGLAEVLADGISSAIAAVRGFLDSVQPNLQEIAEGIAQKINQFVQNVNWAELGQIIHDGINAALEFLITILDNLDWDSIGQAVVDFLSNLQWGDLMGKWGDIVGTALGGALKGIDLGDALSLGFDIVGGIIEGMLNKWNESGGILGWIKRTLFSPFVEGFKSLFGIHSPSTVMAEQGGYLVEGLLQGISDTWNSIVSFFSEKVEGIKKTLSDAWSAIKENASSIFSGIKENISEIWSNLKEKTASTWSNIKTDLSTKWSSIKSSADSKWSEIKTSLINTWQEISTNAGSKFSEIKESIINKMNELKDNDWASIGKSVVDGIVSGLQSIWNTLTGWVRDVKNAIEDAFSGASKSRGGGFGTSGSGSFGGGRMSVRSIPELPISKIPALAQGAVIPPNREFLAVLGDQRSGNNLEAPEELIRKIVREESGGGNAELVQLLQSILNAVRDGHIIMVDGTVLGRTTIKAINSVNTAAGKQLLWI